MASQDHNSQDQTIAHSDIKDSHVQLAQAGKMLSVSKIATITRSRLTMSSGDYLVRGQPPQSIGIGHDDY
jgi:ElaB/YqjD/DUF883 family membrane-anchored ribosome-binding protein